ncbi:MAG: IS5 family transposase, partial [Pseudomonadota bacterium]|nr:IS5 family transposase [Pseudomonadota bacterium]
MMHEKEPLPDKNRAPMIRYRSQKQQTLPGFETPFEMALDKHNRWVKLSECIPWDELAEGYYQSLSSKRGRPAKDARLVIGAVIIKHKLCLSDEETVQQIQENPYMQYFVGLPAYQGDLPFVPSLFVEIRKRMGQGVFEAFHEAIIESLEAEKVRQAGNRKRVERERQLAETKTDRSSTEDKEEKAEPDERQEEPGNRGKLILDATVADQAIRYPTDLSLLNEAREFSEKIIDTLYPHTHFKNKPRSYRRKARAAYLAMAKQRRPGTKVRRRGIRQQLQYLRRNLGHIERLLESWPMGEALPLPRWLMRRYWVIQHVYAQQWEMYRSKTQRCDDRIVSISQPYVRPIVRGKLAKPVEFGAKLSVSLNGDGIAGVDHLRWDAFNEGGDLPAQVESYRDRSGHYPEAVLADPLYGTRANRYYLAQRGIRFAGKPLGRPKKITDANREALKQLQEQRRKEYRQRIPIEGKFGQGKGGYRLNYIRAKRADTSLAWINSIFLVMNLLVLYRVFIGF